jgi:hypothetical protein
VTQPSNRLRGSRISLLNASAESRLNLSTESFEGGSLAGAYAIPAAFSSCISIEVSWPIRAMTGKMSAEYSII